MRFGRKEREGVRMDELTKKRLEKEMELRKKEDEEFMMIMDARLKRQAILKSAVKKRDEFMVGDVVVEEDDEEEETYTVTRDKDGEFEVEKINDQED
jgi:hypothetical protein